MGRAQSIESLPSDSPAPLSWATRYAIDAAVRLGPEVQDVRKRGIRRLRRKAKQLRPLNELLLGIMPENVRRISKDTHPAFVLYCIILLGWPDLEYLNGLIF